MTKTALFGAPLWMGLVAVVAALPAEAMDYGPGSLGSEDPTTRGRAITAMRQLGPLGLEKALALHDRYQVRLEALQHKRLELTTAAHAPITKKGTTGADRRFALIEAQIGQLDAELARVRDAIDQIGGQRSCSVSRLFWYTDLGEAQAEAERTGRPILSLRMLGRLTDEFSCANSRFFRTTLYSNQQISDFLRDHFVLHWQSVRPVPRVTIDFGDGRVLQRTLTGNSAHYVLASDGQPLDVLPGLYSPQQFQAWLAEMHGLHGGYLAATSVDRPALLAAHHAARVDLVLRQWDQDIERVGGDRAEVVLTRVAARSTANGPEKYEATQPAPAPIAAKAARLAVGKAAVEVAPMRFANLGGERLERGMDDELWQAIANVHRANVKLDEASVAVVRAEFPTAAAAGRLATSKRVQEDPVMRMVRQFEDSIALDTVRNEYLLHRRVHERFAAGDSLAADLDALNEWVYAELFLTPSSDPWLGLAPSDVYTALENGGQAEPDRLTRRGD
jgi:hypothetical protein